MKLEITSNPHRRQSPTQRYFPPLVSTTRSLKAKCNASIRSFLILALFFIVFAAAENVEYKCSTTVTFDGDKMRKKLTQITGYYQATLVKCRHRGPCIRKNLLKLIWHIVKHKRAENVPEPEGTYDLSVRMKPLEDESNKTPRRHRNIYQIVARCSKGSTCVIAHVTEKPRGKKAQEIICSRV